MNDLLYFLVLLNYGGEAITQAMDLASDRGLLFFRDLELPILFRTQLGLLDRVDALVSDVLSLTRQLQLRGKVSLI